MSSKETNKFEDEDKRPTFSNYFEENETNSCDDVLKFIETQFKFAKKTPDMSDDNVSSCEKIAKYISLNFDLKTLELKTPDSD